MSDPRDLAIMDQVRRSISSANKMIFVTFLKEGIHCYPEAGTNPDLADVSFLASRHRHVFHFRVDIEVFHNERDIEFIQFKRWLMNLYDSGIMDLNAKSCEMIADELYIRIAVHHPGRDVRIEVSEDHENGATIFYSK